MAEYVHPEQGVCLQFYKGLYIERLYAPVCIEHAAWLSIVREQSAKVSHNLWGTLTLDSTSWWKWRRTLLSQPCNVHSYANCARCDVIGYTASPRLRLRDKMNDKKNEEKNYTANVASCVGTCRPYRRHAHAFDFTNILGAKSPRWRVRRKSKSCACANRELIYFSNWDCGARPYG